MTPSTARDLMKRAIEVARNSEAEDDRLHPKVGAVLASDDGTVHLTAFRGQAGDGDHAEFALLEEAKAKELPLSTMTLFVTLEPCSRRSPKKLPCAVRVARSGIRTVYVGTLDPNPQIIGRGVNFLVESGVTVEHFPADLRKELIDLNTAFIGQHGYLVDPIIPDPDDIVVGRQRSGILTTTLEMIATAKDEVRILAGDTSWLRDLFVGLLEASLRSVPIRMIVQKPLTRDKYSHLQAIGVEVVDATADHNLRATMTKRDGQPSQLIAIESEPARHAQLFSAPHDKAVLNTFSDAFERMWDQTKARKASMPALRAIEIADVASALRKGVAQYRSSAIALEKISLGDLQFLTNDVEILKLRRVASTVRIMTEDDRRAPLSIVGTPWAFFPPIVERSTQGVLVLIDGIHRVYDALQRGQTDVEAIVVDCAEAPLPATPLPKFEANILPRKRERVERYNNYNANAFREIRQALESGGWTPFNLG